MDSMDGMDGITPEERRQAEAFVSEARRGGGLAPIDLELFWSDQAVAAANPFGADIPQVAFGAQLTGECVYTELGVPVDMWRYAHDQEWALGLNKAYNDKAEQIVGKRILNETPRDPSRAYPSCKSMADLFEAESVWHDQSWWLRQSAYGPEELSALLDRVEARLDNLRAFLLPPEWDAEKKRLMALGIRPPTFRGMRGPVTFATSIYGAEEFIYLVLDEPELAGRLRDVMLRAMLFIARLLDDEAGVTPDKAPRGCFFCDDNCCLMTPEMYDFFAYPILKGLFDAYAPAPGDWRYQHSDSAMGHLLPILGRLDMKGVNFGPTVRAADIRRYMPNAVIEGTLAPFAYSRNEEVNIVAAFLRDHRETRPTRGLRFATAGSINDGTRLTSMRLVMAAIQRFGSF